MTSIRKKVTKKKLNTDQRHVDRSLAFAEYFFTNGFATISAYPEFFADRSPNK